MGFSFLILQTRVGFKREKSSNSTCAFFFFFLINFSFYFLLLYYLCNALFLHIHFKKLILKILIGFHSSFVGNNEMGLLSTLLKWNKGDPPSREEKLRNDRICKFYQHNRNPFIDHPEYAQLIWKQISPIRESSKFLKGKQ